jgi:PAS domain S-box-containing protein
MSKNKRQNYKKQAKSANGRPTIGFLTGFRDQFFHLMWCGIADVARERNINALCFAGNYVYDPEGFKIQANILYDLLDAEQLDGLVIWGLMCNMLDPDQTRQFYERYEPLPIVSVAQPIDGITNVLVDNYAGMRQAIVHLIEVHGRRRIAYIKGFPNFQEHDDRYRAYVDALAEYGLPFDPARVAAPRDAAEMEQPDWGRVALRRLLDEQKTEFDALVTNDDRFAHDLLPELQARGIRVPEDMALVSFDNTEGSDCLTPPLTTVPFPMYELGRQAAETLLAQLAGQEVLEEVEVPARLIVRQSCGCVDPKVKQVLAGPVTRTDAAEPLEVSLTGQRESIMTEMMETVEKAAAGLSPNWAEQLLDSFVAALTTAETGEASARFLSTLDEILRQVLAAEGDIEVWPQVLSILRRQLLPYLSIDEARDRAEDLWLQAQMTIGEVRQRAQAYRDLQAEQRKRILGEIGTTLATNFDVNDLVGILARELPRLGISRGYLSLYENPQPYRYPQLAPQWSRLVLAYDDENPAGSSRVALEGSRRRFPSRQLVPPEILPQQGPLSQQGAYTLVVQALYFQNEQIGILMLDGDQRDGDVYSMLRAQISSALQGALLVQRVQERSAELTRQQYILDTFMDNVPDQIYFKDLDCRITRANRAHAAKLGFSDPAEEIGKADFDFFPEEQARAKYEQEQEIIRTGQPILNLEEADGVGRWALTTKMPLRDEKDEIIGTFGISRDITTVKETQAALEKAYAEVEQQVQERTAELQREITERERLQQEVIEAQQRAIRELSTPVIPITDHILVMPLIGSIDTMRAKDITRALLAGISRHRAKVVILDMTGVPLVDTQVVNYLNKTMQAAQLKGTQTIVTGLTEAVAEAIVDLGIDWSGIQTLADLQTGLKAALGSLGLKLIRHQDRPNRL